MLHGNHFQGDPSVKFVGHIPMNETGIDCEGEHHADGYVQVDSNGDPVSVLLVTGKDQAAYQSLPVHILHMVRDRGPLEDAFQHALDWYEDETTIGRAEKAEVKEMLENLMSLVPCDTYGDNPERDEAIAAICRIEHLLEI